MGYTQGSRQNFCIWWCINDLEGLHLVNNGCGQLHVRELQVTMQRSKAKQKLVKGQQLTSFGE